MKEPLRRLWMRLWPVISGVSLRVKIIGIALLMIAVLGLGLTAQTRATLARSLERELEQRALSIARDLAFRSTDLILTNNLYSLYVLMRETVQNHEDVRYAFVVDPQGNLLAHSFEGGFPPDLLTANRVEAGEAYHREVFRTEEGLVQDVAVPVFGGRAGTVRVGMSYRRLEATVGGATRQLLLTTLGVSLLGVGLSSLLTWVLTRPVRMLEEATRRVAEGDLSQRVSPWADDEIGHLQKAFKEMVEHLERSRREMEAFNRDLVRRNRELSTLYRVSRVLAGPTELERALEEVLGETIAALGAEGGWVCLTGREEACRVQASFWADASRARALSECPKCAACLATRARGQPAVLSAPSAECPACPLCNGDGATEVHHALVPLQVKGASDIYQEIIPSIGDAYPYPVKILFIYMGTPVYSLPAGNTNIEVLKDPKKIPLIVASDIVVGETSMYADYIFPDLSYLERWEFAGSHPSVAWKVQPVRQPIIPPLTETVRVYGQEMPLSLEAMLLGLAEALGLPNFGPNGLGEGVPLTHPDDLYLRMVANLAFGEKEDGSDAVPDADDDEVRLFLEARKHLPGSVFDPERKN